ncbi:hypothetical protein HELRODRAFT_191975 [Helobdella robusta]|uniref:RING-type domain-containing protein n=1 Tax=Helobdella robusta TaxID=6412 RepID=T1FTH2_HELRO|nr:hypothetical protein HELRODRAFT_191975 [Helobdella robusta]ESO03259.1 hypothetical protein HELRODRAFT_191975 [Helobdella robusta]
MSSKRSSVLAVNFSAATTSSPSDGNLGTCNEPSPSEFEELLQCMICFESFNDPKILNCAHTFCAKCLDDYHATYATQKRAVSGNIPCPTCRELTPWPENGVEGLRRDFKIYQIEELLKNMSVLSQSNSGQSLNVCNYCNALDKKVQAKNYCFNCEKSYCTPCMGKHSKNQLFNNHKVISLPTKNSSDFPCKYHPNEIIKYFCKSCDTVACTLCLLDQHNNHNAIEIKQMINEQLSDINFLMAGVNEKKDELMKELEILEPITKNCSKSIDEAEKLIRSRSETIIREVKNKEIVMLKTLDNIKNSKLKHLEKEIDRIKFNLNKLKGIESMMKNSTMTPSKSLRTYDLLIQRMRTILDVDSQLDVNNLSQNSIFVKFKPGSEEFNFGNLDEKRFSNTAQQSQLNQTPASYPELRSRSKTQPNLELNDPKYLKPCLKRSISKDENRAKLNFEILVHGSKSGELNKPLWVASLLEYKFVVSDGGNKRLQIFDQLGKSVNVILAKSLEPLGIAVTMKNNIITADTDQKRIQVFSPDGKSISKWGLGKFFNPCGVAVCPNGSIIVSDVGDNSVSVYKNENTCVFRLGISAQPELQFKEPFYVASGQNNEIIVSDSKNHCVKIFDSGGQFVAKIGSEGSKDGEFKSPRGVCTSVEGYIIVADQENNRVTMLTREGSFVKHLLTSADGIKSPQGVCLTRKKKLAVTEFDPPKYSTLKVFDVTI